MSISSRRKLYLTVLISFLSAALTILVFLILLGRIQDFDSKFTDVESQIASLEEERVQAKNETVLLKDRQADLARLNDMFVDPNRPLAFVEAIQKTADITQNELALDLLNEKNSGGYLSFKITLDGTPTSVLRYLKAVELLPFQITIVDFSFQKLSGQSPALGGVIKSKFKFVPTGRLIIDLRVKTS